MTDWHQQCLQELLVEVWHHCPRSQVVAAAMSQGGSTSDQALKFRDVFLGSGSAPLHALLNKPQVCSQLYAQPARVTLSRQITCRRINIF